MKLLVLFLWAFVAIYAGDRFIYALGYLDNDLKSDRLEIGSYKIKGNLLQTDSFQYDAFLNALPTQLDPYHNMQTPYSLNSCKNRHIEAPTATRRIQTNGKIAISDDLAISVGTMTYHWNKDVQKKNFFVLQSIKSADGIPLQNVVGFGFMSDDFHGDITRKNFSNRYNGNIFHKNAKKNVSDVWEFMDTMLQPSLFTDYGDLLEYNSKGSVQLKNPVWSHNTLALNQYKDIPFKIINDYGHDFNKNGCYDEFGHNKVIFAGFDSSHRIDRMVFIEYSYNWDGYPMLSVGRYY